MEKMKGKNWSALKEGYLFVVSIDDKEAIVATLNDFVAQTGIKAGSIIGIGAVNQVTLKFYEPENGEYKEKVFTEQLEMTNLTGNIALLNGEPLLHLHITLGRGDYTALAGHLEEAIVSGACELYVQEIRGEVKKDVHPENGLNIYTF
ncbi:PPC domain-containing DNA-binding protein [Gynurincola endophyticus]|uniref:PPC domain-containing DNA-binding protein n=1 Tax=Gynurincola endophyticus TaxID=2479004 RepID=UPI000F8D3EC0|nr:PPC domain-containing DNA-binding protein [Gynurincola endophyticus]